MASKSSGIVKNDKISSKFKFRMSYIVILILLLLVAGGGAYGYTRYTKLQDENKRLSNPQEAAKSDTERIKAEVAGLIEVPTDEEPTIATVADASKLSAQTFFAKAKNGDRVIMYQKAKKAILYRPETKKIIEVAPINIGDSVSKEVDAAAKATQPAATDPSATPAPAAQ